MFTRYLVLFFIPLSILAESKITDAFINGNIDAEVQLFYYKIDKENKDLAYATSLGGFLKYTTDTNNTIFASLGFHTSNKVGNAKNERLTLLFDNDKDSNYFIANSEAFLAYETSTRVIKLGNMLLNTPMMNNDNTRIVPWSYQGFAYTGDITADTRVQLYYINAIRSHTSNRYKKNSASGEIGHSGVSMLSLHYSGMDGIMLQSYYYYAPELYSTFVFQTDYEYSLSDTTLLCLGTQYFNSGSGGKYAKSTNIYGGDDINLVALKANIDTDKWQLSLNYSQNFGVSGLLRGYGGLAKVYTSSMVANGRGNYKPETWMLKSSYNLPFKSYDSEIGFRLTNTKVHDSRGHGFNAYYLHYKQYFNADASLYIRYENLNFTTDKNSASFFRIITKYRF